MMTLLESIVDRELEHFSPYVFDDYKEDNPTLRNDVRTKIIKDVLKIDERVNVIDYFIKGSSLTKTYNNRSDIDIYVQVESDVHTEEELRDLLYDVWQEIDDTHLKGVPHPFQYYISSNVYNMENTVAAYDVKKNEWIKREPTKHIDIDDYMDEFKDYVDQFSNFYEELRRSIIDYEILKDVPPNELKNLESKAEEKIEEIDSIINDLTEIYRELKQYRTDAFSEDMTPSDIKKYGSKSALPGNVIFKLIERYYYLDLVKKIKKIIGNGGVTKENIDKLNDVLKTKLTKENVGISKTDILYPSSRNHRHRRLCIGDSTAHLRKTQRIVPDYVKKDPNKTNRKIENAKRGNKIIKVKRGSPRAIQLAKKYRIGDPRGKKTVAGNQYDPGITIVFEETIEQKIQRAKKVINNLNARRTTD